MEPVKFDMGEGRMFQGYTGISYIEKYIEYLKKFEPGVQRTQLSTVIRESKARLQELAAEGNNIMPVIVS